MGSRQSSGCGCMPRVNKIKDSSIGEEPKYEFLGNKACHTYMLVVYLIELRFRKVRIRIKRKRNEVQALFRQHS